mgnify:CR=1 FL=1
MRWMRLILQTERNRDQVLEFYSKGRVRAGEGAVVDNTNLNQGMPNHVVPQGTVLSSKQAYVVFGGGTVNGDFGNAIVHTASAAVLNLNNASDTLTIKNDIGEVLIVFVFKVTITLLQDSFATILRNIWFCLFPFIF